MTIAPADVHIITLEGKVHAVREYETRAEANPDGVFVTAYTTRCDQTISVTPRSMTNPRWVQGSPVTCARCLYLTPRP